jgi:CheY-like chemotaxis protein
MADPEPRRPRITVVNDSPEFLELMHELLEEESGYDASVIEGDRISSIEPIRASRPDLIIVDLRLAQDRMSGWQILREIRDDDDLRRVPVLICTADQEELKKRTPELDKMPRLAILLKPFTVAELESEIRGLIG